jgi:hypothetical protein
VYRAGLRDRYGILAAVAGAITADDDVHASKCRVGALEGTLERVEVGVIEPCAQDVAEQRVEAKRVGYPASESRTPSTDWSPVMMSVALGSTASAWYVPLEQRAVMTTTAAKMDARRSMKISPTHAMAACD